MSVFRKSGIEGGTERYGRGPGERAAWERRVPLPWSYNVPISVDTLESGGPSF